MTPLSSLALPLSSSAAAGDPVAAPSPEGSDGSSAKSPPASTAASVGHVVTSQYLNDSDTGPNPGDTNSLSNATMVEGKNGTVKATSEEDSGNAPCT